MSGRIRRKVLLCCQPCEVMMSGYATPSSKKKTSSTPVAFWCWTWNCPTNPGKFGYRRRTVGIWFPDAHLCNNYWHSQNDLKHGRDSSSSYSSIKLWYVGFGVIFQQVSPSVWFRLTTILVSFFLYFFSVAPFLFSCSQSFVSDISSIHQQHNEKI
jgi:hypothetical protein